MGAIITPATTAVTLGLVGQKNMPARLGVNEAWNHAGNCATAVLGGVFGYYFGIPAVFAVMAVMGLLSLCFLHGINPAHIDHDVARGLEKGDGNHAGETAAPLWRMLQRNSALLIVALTLFFFHLGNAAILPLLGQAAVADFRVNPAAYTAGTIILAQLTMVGMALLAAKVADKYGYGTLFTAALIVLPFRGLIAGFYDSAWRIIPVQLLDGVAAGLIGVATPGIVTRIMRGSGHINLGLGFVLTIQSVGAALSSSYGGIFARQWGYSASFLALAAVPCLGLILFLAARFRLPLLQQS